MPNSQSHLPWDESKAMPALYTAADAASAANQKAHLWILRTNYGLIALGAFFGVLASFTAEIKSISAIISAISLLLGTLMSATIRTLGYDRKWFDARAIAESVKTLVWRYLMGSGIFDIELPPKEADKNFHSRIVEILQNRKGLGRTIAGFQNPGAQITEAMRSSRAGTLEERKLLYVGYRIKDQLSWYTKKAAWNKKRSVVWTGVATAMQGLAAVWAILLASNRNWRFNIVPFLTTLATILLGWARIKKHDELSDSYAVAAQELCSALALADYIDSEKELSTFVGDVEQIISREHTMWVSRKDSNQ